MAIRRLEARTYRNFDQLLIDLPSRLLVVGLNGVGKTNLLESLRVLSVGKSFKTNRFDDLIQFNQPFLRLQVESDDKRLIELFYGRNSKEEAKTRLLKIDRSPIGLMDFWGQFTTVVFLPTDSELVLGEPRLRRRLLDGVFWQIDREYRQTSVDLNKALNERRAAIFNLKRGRLKLEELEPWNQIVMERSRLIQTKRAEFIDFLNQFLHQEVSGEISAEYQPNTTQPAEVVESELRLVQNLIGSPRDEVEFKWHGRSARRFVSRGQARKIAIMVRLAEIAFLQSKGFSPVVLLDDPLSELDEQAARQLLERFKSVDQVIATAVTTSPIFTDYQLHQLGQDK